MVLFAMSLIFYAWGEPVYILVMLLSILEAYVCGLFIAKYSDTSKKKARFFMILSVSLNLVSLLFFKYCNFFIENLKIIQIFSSVPLIKNLVLPIGISFYTFQSMSYTIDVYRNQIKCEKSFINVDI